MQSGYFCCLYSFVKLIARDRIADIFIIEDREMHTSVMISACCSVLLLDDFSIVEGVRIPFPAISSRRSVSPPT